jgi:hypothetical protein
MTVFTPHDANGNPIAFDKSNPVWVEINKDRARITVEICYCSTLGECWTLRGGAVTPGTTSRPVVARLRLRLHFSSSQEVHLWKWRVES